MSDNPSSNWFVTFTRSPFGAFANLPFDGALTLLLYRKNSGWTTCSEEICSSPCLSHQVYMKKIDRIVALNPYEIVAVNLETAQWVTIWAENEREATHPISHLRPSAVTPSPFNLNP